MSQIKTIRIKITGRVQAVFFRDSAKRFAERNNLKGFVENKKDGSVEMLASGQEEGIRNLLDWCYRGSLLSRVESLSYEFLDNTNLKVDEVINSDEGFKVNKHNRNYLVDKFLALSNFAKRYYHKYNKSKQEGLSDENKENADEDLSIKELENKPNHIAIIPDGNRRWAKEKGDAVWNGHRAGAENFKSLISYSFKNGIKYVTAWGFSTENWSRNQEEVDMLMNIFLDFIKSNRNYFIENKIRFCHFGRKDRISKSLREEIESLEQETSSFSLYNFAIALDYGGQDEIRRAVEGYVKNNTLIPLENFLDTIKFPEADLIIRTGGEQRSSGMMPWQSAYAEFYFSPLYFPDFKEEELKLALLDFANRKRRYGK